MNNTDPQSVQLAINACDSAHTGIHRAIASLKEGGNRQAKFLIAQQIAALAQAMAVL